MEKDQIEKTKDRMNKEVLITTLKLATNLDNFDFFLAILCLLLLLKEPCRMVVLTG